MQIKSEEKCSIAHRLDSLRVTQQLSWKQTAEAIGLSESMIYQVKSGKKALSPKALHRLAAAERKAGLAPSLVTQAAQVYPDLDEVKSVLREGTPEEWMDILSKDQREVLFEYKLSESNMQMGHFFLDVGGLISVTEDYLADPSKKNLAEVRYFITRLKKHLPISQKTWDIYFSRFLAVMGFEMGKAGIVKAISNKNKS